MEKIFSIAIDGPAGAGKSTIAHQVAEEMGATVLDTGAMYRAVGLYFLRRGMERDRQVIARHVEDMNIGVQFVDGKQRMLLDGEDVTSAIRTAEASMAASSVSAVPEVRARLVRLQQEIAKGISIVMEGRDIGTKVLPNATLKLYLTASAEVRAMRRYSELREKGEKPVFHEILDDIIERDYNDSHREASPLVQAEDAVLLDSSYMTLRQVCDRVIALCRERIGD